jgi:pimeloyl-ACP methyl ester carboxylesterase
VSRVPNLRFHGNDARVEAVVLLLPGGAADGYQPVRAFDHAALRMFPFGRSVVRAGEGRIALVTLRYAVRGWNGEQESPLPDARWALDQTAARYGELPIGLVGHSMGGRVALRMADYGGDDHPMVRSLAALAPWLPDGEPLPELGDRPLLLAHGDADRITDPGKTADLADKLHADGRDVEFVKFPGARHDMLFPAGPWHKMVASFMVKTLLAPATGSPADR